MNERVPQEVLRKIQAALALAENPGTEGEAAAAVAAVSRLLQKYNLSIEDVPSEDSRGKALGEITTIETKHLAHDSARKAQWIHAILGGLREAYFVEVLVSKRNVYFIGREVNAKAATDTFHYLYGTLVNMAQMRKTEYIKDFKFRHGMSPTKFPGAHPTNYRTSWLIGAAFVVADRLKETVAEHNHNQVTALMVVSDQEIKDYMADEFGKTRHRPARKTDVNIHGFDQGQRDGADIPLSKAKEFTA